MTVAHAAEEAKSEGTECITPYWRTLKMGGILNGKFPGGAEAHWTNPNMKVTPLKLPPGKSQDEIACQWEFKLGPSG